MHASLIAEKAVASVYLFPCSFLLKSYRNSSRSCLLLFKPVSVVVYLDELLVL